MTAQDAFAIAFDEWNDEDEVADVEASDSIPTILDENVALDKAPKKPKQNGWHKGTKYGKTGSAAMPGVTNSMASMGGKKEQSLAEHMAQYHKNGFDPKVNTCKLFDSIKEGLIKQGLSAEAAEAQALRQHNGGAANIKINPAQAGGTSQTGTNPQQPQNQNNVQPAANPQPAILSPEEAKPKIEALVQNPEAIPNTPGEQIVPQTINGMEVKTTTAAAAATVLGEASNEGYIRAEKIEGEVKAELEQQHEESLAAAQGTGGQTEEPLIDETMEFVSSQNPEWGTSLTAVAANVIRNDPSGKKKELMQAIVDTQYELEQAELEGEEPGILGDIRDSLDALAAQFWENGNTQKVEPQPEEEQMEFTSSDGKWTMNAPPDVEEIIRDHPEKKDLYQKIVDTEWAFQNAKTDEEKNALNEQKKKLSAEFLASKPSEEQSAQAGTTEEAKATQTEPEQAASASTQQTSQARQQETQTEEPPLEEPPRSGLAPAPADSEFEIGKNTYKVGDTVYKDISGMGLFRSLITSFLAGYRGQNLITGLDRASGAWDMVKRSANGEYVRDGIASAMVKSTLSSYLNRDDLSEEAKAEMEAINEMMSKAKTPEAKLRAMDKYKKWKEAYKSELGEDKKQSVKTYPPLPNDYKGKKAPLSILKKPEDFKADKEFGNTVAKDLVQCMNETLGTPVNVIESINVGPNATTIELSVPPDFNIKKAKSKESLEKIQGATSAPVAHIGYVTGKKNVISVTVKNPQLRDVSFSSIMHSKEWQEFADKAALPVPLGKDASGNNQYMDIAKMPHMIVTGASGGGKSIFFASAIAGLEMAKTPDQARVVILDPKNEFKSQDGSPHLLYPRAKETKDIAGQIASLRALMEERISKIGGENKEFDPSKNEYQGDSEHNISEYNAAHPNEKPMEHVLTVFDEFAKVSKDPEYGPQVLADVSQLLALGRSVGIDLMIGTQRNDVASIPGEIQANAPCHLAFQAAADDAKASAEVKALAGSGEYILFGKGNKQTRGRACFISNEEISAVPSYYRDHMEGSPDEENETPAPEETESEAVVEQETVPEGGNEEASEVETETTTEETLDDWRKANSREEAVSVVTAKRDKEKEKAWAEYNKSKNTAADKNKLKKALEKADADFSDEEELINMKYSDVAKEGDETAGEPGGTEADGSETEGDTPAAMMKDIQTQFAAEEDRIKEALKKPNLKIRDKRKLRQELDALKKRFGEAKTKYENNGTADEILNVYEPEEKSGKENKGRNIGVAETQEQSEWETPYAAGQKPENRIKKAQMDYQRKAADLEKRRAKGEITDESAYNAALKRLDDDYNKYVKAVNEGKSDADILADTDAANQAIRDKIQTTNKGSPIHGSEHISKAKNKDGTRKNVVKMPKALAEKARQSMFNQGLEGFEIDSDAAGNPLWIDGQYGLARNPKTGVFGKIKPDGTFKKLVDPTHPKFKGEKSPEAKAAKAAWQKAADKDIDSPEADSLLKEYNLISRGVETLDEAVNNKTIVANAVANALAFLGD